MSVNIDTSSTVHFDTSENDLEIIFQIIRTNVKLLFPNSDVRKENYRRCYDCADIYITLPPDRYAESHIVLQVEMVTDLMEQPTRIILIRPTAEREQQEKLLLALVHGLPAPKTWVKQSIFDNL